MSGTREWCHHSKCHSSRNMMMPSVMPVSLQVTSNSLLLVIIIIMLPNQAIASTPSASRPSGAEGRGSTAPLCLQLLRTACCWWHCQQ
jgi:hypothetical protein